MSAEGFCAPIIPNPRLRRKGVKLCIAAAGAVWYHMGMKALIPAAVHGRRRFFGRTSTARLVAALDADLYVAALSQTSLREMVQGCLIR